MYIGVDKLKIDGEVIEGIFLRESKNRFLCEVIIDNEVCECYIPSSSRLENYINLRNKKILLLKNKGTNIRTKYSVFAVKYYNKYIILNLSYANKILENEIIEKRLYTECGNFLREHKIGDYKADFFIEDSAKGIVVEVKGLIDTRKMASFPTVFSERAIGQLEKIEGLLREGYKVDYYIISLSPIVKKIDINTEQISFFNLLKACVSKGMRVHALVANMNINQVTIIKNDEIFI